MNFRPYSNSFTSDPIIWTMHPWRQYSEFPSFKTASSIIDLSTGSFSEETNLRPPGLISSILTFAAFEKTRLSPIRTMLIVPKSGLSGRILKNFLEYPLYSIPSPAASLFGARPRQFYITIYLHCVQYISPTICHTRV